MPTAAEIRTSVTAQIVAALEGGQVIPWRRPWSVNPNSQGRTANAVSKRPYSGINTCLTELHRLRYGFTSKFFVTYEQAKALGGHVGKRPDNVPPGEWACQIVFFKPLEKVEWDMTTGVETKRTIPLLRFHSVFSVDQCSGLEKFKVLDFPDVEPFHPSAGFERAERLIEATGARIEEAGDVAYYLRPQPEGAFPEHTSGDLIRVPPRKRFVNYAHYIETCLHELAHWSEVRLGHDRKQHSYAFYELVAEMSACFLSAELGVPDSEDRTNHVAYLGSWLSAMKSDPSFLFQASSMASKTCDYLLAKLEPVEGKTVTTTAVETIGDVSH